MEIGRRRRLWPDEEKRRIVAESREAGASVSVVARRHDVNANLVFTWRRDPRFGAPATEPCFLPVTVFSDGVEGHERGVCGDGDGGLGAGDPPVLKGVEIALGTDLRLCFAEGLAEAALVRLVRALRRAA